MIEIDIKQMDLNYLFQFDLLKQILINLSKNQESLNQELNKINESNIKRDERITRLENSYNLETVIPEKNLIHSTQSELDNLNTEKNENIIKEEKENNTNANKTSNEEEKIEDKNVDKNENIKKEEDNLEKNNDNKNQVEKEDNNIYKEEKDKDNNQQNQNEEKKDLDKNKEENNVNNEKGNIKMIEIVPQQSVTTSLDNKDKEINKMNEKSISNNERRPTKKHTNFENKNKNISSDLYLSMMKGNREQKEKMNNLENKLLKEIELQIKKIKEDFKRQIKNINQENKSSFDKLDEQILSLSQKNVEQDEKIEDCILKSNNFDIFNVIKDNGDGTVDLAKLMIKALEDKIFKKFEFIDQRHKQEGMELMKISKMSENINHKMDRMERNFDEIKNSEINQMKEDIENNKSNNEKKIEEVNNIMNEKEINLEQKIKQLETNILKLLDEKDIDLNKKYQEISDEQKNEKFKINEEELNLLKNKTSMDEETVENIERRINDLRSKINNIDSSLKYIMKDWNIEILKKDIKEMKLDIEKKITKDNLKELYNLHISDLEEINDLREHTSVLYEDLKKTIRSVSAISPKVESLMGHFLALKQTNKNLKAPQIDTSRFIDNIKFNEGINLLYKKFDNVYREIDSMRRDYYDIKDEQKLFEKKERVNRLEEEIYNKFEEIKGRIQKNKNEINKVSKGFEVEIKAIWNEFKKKEQADSWILAKQPMKCFNCATCDNNIKNQIPSDESVPWNRYPQNEKNYRLGKGFSHMLEMMTYEFIKNLDDDKDGKEGKEYQPISEENNLYSSINNGGSEESNMDLNEKNSGNKIIANNIAQIERSSSTPKLIKEYTKENNKTILPVNSGRIRLPQVYEISQKKLKIENFKHMNSLSAQEKINVNEKNGNEKIKRNDSPQILKITKKKNNNNQIFSPVVSSRKKINSDLNI